MQLSILFKNAWVKSLSYCVMGGLTCAALAGCQTADQSATKPEPTTAIDTNTNSSNSASRGPANCSDFFDPALTLPIEQLPATSTLALYQERCNGGLYLVNKATKATLVRVNPGWWFENLLAATAAGDSLIKVNATFITGVGPTGVVPFPAQFIVSQDAQGQWQTEQLPLDDTQPSWLEPDLVEITTAAQLESIQLKTTYTVALPEIDFSTQRLLLKSIWLTSGSEKITAVSVYRNRRGYFVTYDSKSPRIGTMDMKHVVLHLVLPKDHRYVSFEDPELDAKPFKSRVVVLERASFRGQLAP